MFGFYNDYYGMMSGKWNSQYGSAKYIPKRSLVIKNKIRKARQKKNKRK